MTSPNWGLLQNNALAHLGAGLQLGQGMTDRREAREQNNAMLDLQRQREARLQQQEQAQQAQQQTTQRRNDAPVIARLLQGAQDEPSYQQTLALAQQYGIDTSDAPPAYDPQWVQSTVRMAEALQTSEGRTALSKAGKDAADALGGPQAIGTPEHIALTQRLLEAELAQPYMGSGGETRLYTPNVFGPGQSRGPQPGQVEEGYRFKGGDPADPNSWEPVSGGPTLSASGGFPGY